MPASLLHAAQLEAHELALERLGKSFELQARLLRERPSADLVRALGNLQQRIEAEQLEVERTGRLVDRNRPRRRNG